MGETAQAGFIRSNWEISMKVVRRVGCAVITCTTALLVAASPAAAEDRTPGADVVAAAVNAVSSDAQRKNKVAAKEAGNGFAARAGNVRVSIPADATGVVTTTAATTHGTLRVSVGTGIKTATPGQLANDGSVVYDGIATDATVQPTDGGVRIHTVLGGRTAPTEFRHVVTLPAGMRLVRERDMRHSDGTKAPATAKSSEAVFIVNRGNRIVGGFSSPWAKDAKGAHVPTRYEIRDGGLVQVVDHRSGDWAYPIVADPWLGFDLISSARWVWHSEGWTMEVTPTGWARWQAGGYWPGVAGWDELYAKYRYRGLNTNLDGMRDQYICHQQVVAVRAPNKPTWNLDEWRPNVSYWETVNTSCNPGGARWFD